MRSGFEIPVLAFALPFALASFVTGSVEVALAAAGLALAAAGAMGVARLVRARPRKPLVDR